MVWGELGLVVGSGRGAAGAQEAWAWLGVGGRGRAGCKPGCCGLRVGDRDGRGCLAGVKAAE